MFLQFVQVSEEIKHKKIKDDFNFDAQHETMNTFDVNLIVMVSFEGLD